MPRDYVSLAKTMLGKDSRKYIASRDKKKSIRPGVASPPRNRPVHVGNKMTLPGGPAKILPPSKTPPLFQQGGLETQQGVIGPSKTPATTLRHRNPMDALRYKYPSGKGGTPPPSWGGKTYA